MKGWHNGVVGVVVSYTHICLLVESSVTDVNSSSQTVPCEILQKETFWKVARVVCTLFLVLNLWYGDGSGNTNEENSSIFSLIQMR